MLDHNKNMPVNIPPQTPSFLQIMKEGMAFGAGSAIAHKMIDSIDFSTPTPIIGVGVEKSIEYEKCMKEYDDKAVCEQYK